MPKIKEDDKIELEKILKLHLNPEVGAKIMGSLAHHWEQQGIEKERARRGHAVKRKISYGKD